MGIADLSPWPGISGGTGAERESKATDAPGLSMVDQIGLLMPTDGQLRQAARTDIISVRRMLDMEVWPYPAMNYST